MDISEEEGVLISQVFDDTPAAKGDIQAGDVVLEFNGKTVSEPGQLQSAVAWTKPGTKAKVLLVRGGKRKTVTIEIAQRPERPDLAFAGTGGGKDDTSADLEELGLEVSGVTPEAKERYGYEEGQGVLVAGVETGSLASRAGLEEGMLILQAGGKDVSKVRDLEKIVEDTDLERGLPLLVRAGDRQMFILLKKK
jgi:serine protease Do